MTPADGAAPPPDIDSLVEQLRARVEERRQSGAYPPELEERLAAHFHRITHTRVQPSMEDVREALDDLPHRFDFRVERTPVESRVPGGTAAHKALAKLQARQLVGAYEQMRDFAEGVYTALLRMADAMENANSHVHQDLVGQIDVMLERLAGYERAPAGSPESIADLRRRVEELEDAERRRQFNPWFGNDRFEAEFRGSREQLLSRYQSLAARLEGMTPVLDIGCGRGEFLELLTGMGLDATGVELDPELVAECERRGLKAEAGDGIAALRARPDESLAGISLIQVVEHLSPQQVADLALIAYDKLMPGGRIVVETVNPQSLYVFAHSFFLDPTHSTPIHPAYLTFLFREAGFKEVSIDWRTPPPDDDRLQAVGDEVHDKNVERLNRLLFEAQEYALIAVR